MVATRSRMPPIVIIFCLCLHMTFVLHSNASPLSRNQRQTVRNTSGYSSQDTRTSYQTLGQGSYLPQESAYGGYNVDGGSYEYGQAASGGGIGPNRSYGYGGYAASQPAGYGGQSWRGFGTGKNPMGYRPPVSQSGVKY